jgi:hypothetical protein
MGFDYAGLRSSQVLPALRKYGQAITYRSFFEEAFSQGQYDRTPINTPAYAVVGEYKLGVIDGTMVKVGDKRLMTAEIPEPKAGDEVVVGSTTYTVVTARAVAPSGEPVIYELQVRA